MVTRQIPPDEIDATITFATAFGSHPNDLAARMLVLFAQQQKGWYSFTQSQIDQFAEGTFDFAHLVSWGFIRWRQGAYHFTDRFVDTCVAAQRRRHASGDVHRAPRPQVNDHLTALDDLLNGAPVLSPTHRSLAPEVRPTIEADDDVNHPLSSPFGWDIPDIGGSSDLDDD